MTPKTRRKLERKSRWTAKSWGPVARPVLRPSDQGLGWPKGMQWYDAVPQRERERAGQIMDCVVVVALVLGVVSAVLLISGVLR